MPKETFTKEVLLDILFEDTDKIIQDRIVGNGRWSINHELIFSYNDKLYRTFYRTAATEMQDEQPFQHETNIECEEVIQVVLTGYYAR